MVGGGVAFVLMAVFVLCGWAVCGAVVGGHVLHHDAWAVCEAVMVGPAWLCIMYMLCCAGSTGGSAGLCSMCRLDGRVSWALFCDLPALFCDLPVLNKPWH